MRLRDIGEKALIADIIRPLFNPDGLSTGVGDDCALIEVSGDLCVCVSTDRVPADLRSFKLGLINFRQLGQYLAVLNISDIAAAGGRPVALLLNLAFPPDFSVDDFQSLLGGAKDAADRYGVLISGGDLSDSTEMNLVATSIGLVNRRQALLRSGAKPGDRVFCTDYIGISAAAFAHYLRPSGTNPLTLSAEQELILTKHFRDPVPQVDLGQRLAASGCCTSAMDVTDGIAQSFSEIAAASSAGIVLDADSLPVHDVCQLVASHYKLDPIELVLGAAADFQIVGTLNPSRPAFDDLARHLRIIGEVIDGEGVFLRSSGTLTKLAPRGWNYYV
jgi:thiamine-monophosphate kinase